MIFMIKQQVVHPLAGIKVKVGRKKREVVLAMDGTRLAKCLAVTHFASSNHMNDMKRLIECLVSALWILLTVSAGAVSTSFFDASQTMTVVSNSINSVTIESAGYQFTYSVDGYWSPSPGGAPTGRFFSVVWPAGVQAQAITTGPLVGTGANITIERADGNPFDLESFTGRILANTAGAGGAFEIMPLVDGEDALPDPLQFNCSGYAGQSFSYTPSLVGYDAYKIHLYVDFALTALTLVDASTPPPVASGGSFYQLNGQPLIISIQDLMAQDYSQTGGAVAFVGANATTANGLPLTVDSTAMEIHVPANTVADQFTYTIEDALGTPATGTAVISIIDQLTGRTVGLDLDSNPGAAVASFVGVPWHDYTVQRCTDLRFSGASLRTWAAHAGADGSISIDDDFTDLGAKPDRAFYRLAWP